MSALTVIAECHARAGQEDRLRTALEAMIEPFLGDSGCLAYQPYVNPNDPAHMVIVEHGPATRHWRRTSPPSTSNM